jgi:hypothetical protein
VHILLSNFPKILVSYGTNIEVMKFIITKANADFTKIPNWGGETLLKFVVFSFIKQISFARDVLQQKHSVYIFLSKRNCNSRQH